MPPFLEHCHSPKPIFFNWCVVVLIFLYRHLLTGNRHSYPIFISSNHFRLLKFVLFNIFYIVFVYILLSCFSIVYNCIKFGFLHHFYKFIPTRTITTSKNYFFSISSAFIPQSPFLFRTNGVRAVVRGHTFLYH